MIQTMTRLGRGPMVDPTAVAVLAGVAGFLAGALVGLWLGDAHDAGVSRGTMREAMRREQNDRIEKG